MDYFYIMDFVTTTQYDCCGEKCCTPHTTVSVLYSRSQSAAFTSVSGLHECGTPNEMKDNYLVTRVFAISSITFGYRYIYDLL